MIKIALCDADVSVLSELKNYIKKYRIQHKLGIEAVYFLSPLDLLNEIERGTRFDIIFIDAVMPGESGIDAASEIRNYDENVKIIFLSSSSEFAVQSYMVDAFYYQLKPISEKKFFVLIDSALSSFEKEKANSLILRCKSGITRVRLSEVKYCEVVHRTLYIYITNGKVLECNGSLDDLSRQLDPYSEFLRFHRSYLVNLEHIRHLSYKAVTMSCKTQLPIPRGKYQDVKERYLEYMRKNGQVII